MRKGKKCLPLWCSTMPLLMNEKYTLVFDIDKTNVIQEMTIFWGMEY